MHAAIEAGIAVQDRVRVAAPDQGRAPAEIDGAEFVHRAQAFRTEVELVVEVAAPIVLHAVDDTAHMGEINRPSRVLKLQRIAKRRLTSLILKHVGQRSKEFASALPYLSSMQKQSQTDKYASHTALYGQPHYKIVMKMLPLDSQRDALMALTARQGFRVKDIRIIHKGNYSLHAPNILPYFSLFFLVLSAYSLFFSVLYLYFYVQFSSRNAFSAAHLYFVTDFSFCFHLKIC
ncbi:unnamed protein product [Gongylonema pulchrum]|uniref:RRM domain-containing protein n=1 Tax=Gongylonema pulchrum TaxID=637853 RepID=A0A183EEL6_9BILA|nr:unnamed protein product [Gongylonema pulchrum]